MKKLNNIALSTLASMLICGNIYADNIETLGAISNRTKKG